MSNSSSDLYKKKIDEIDLIYNRFKKKAFSFSWLRILAFILTAIASYFYFDVGEWYMAVAAISSLIAFIKLISIHGKFQYYANLHEAKLDLLHDELTRNELKLATFDEGNRFTPSNHPYADDLDVFGTHSLFQLINRCEIEDSKKLLSQWLLSPSSSKDIADRQQTVKALSGNLEWMLSLSATVRLAVQRRKKTDPEISSEDIFSWSSRTLDIKLSTRKYLAIILSLITIGTIAFIFINNLPYFFGLPIIIVNLVFLGITNKQLSTASKGIDGSKSVLDSYEKAIAEIIDADIDADSYKKVKKHLIDTNALHAIKELNAIVHRASSRSNMMYFVFNTILLFDVHLIIDLEKWRRKNHSAVSAWLDSVHQIECLVSIAGYHINKATHTFPEIIETPFHFEAENLGHPLILDHEKIKNDYSVLKKGTVDILTGSNMSGKSTFQRTIGVNMVLAQIGAPCDAKSLKLSRTLVFTSMRTKDNLEEHTSSFYAELKRIRQLLDIVKKEPSVFFLVDEILKGTNSEDRHIGAVALANQLSRKNTFGIISTHDLKLSEVANENDNVRNFSFNSEIVGDKISFDYKLTKGVCKSFNASQLMRNMGILID
jgi:DNA mismatch repair ATPase MutS